MKRIASAVAFMACLSGCGAGSTAPEARTFDLGLNAPSAKLPALRVASVRAIAPFEGADMHYRLQWRNAAEIAVFAHSRWAATPAELVRKQLLRAANENTGKCGLDLEIHEFTQVFASKDASEARIELRASVSHVSQASTRGLIVVEPNAGSDAASGAAAFTRAVDRAIAELGRWAAAQPGCR